MVADQAMNVGVSILTNWMGDMAAEHGGEIDI